MDTITKALVWAYNELVFPIGRLLILGTIASMIICEVMAS